MGIFHIQNMSETEREKLGKGKTMWGKQKEKKRQYEWITKIKDKQKKEMILCGKRKRKDSKYNTTEI